MIPDPEGRCECCGRSAWEHDDECPTQHQEDEVPYGPEDYITASSIARLRDTGYIQKGMSINHTEELAQIADANGNAADPMDILIAIEEYHENIR